MNYKLKLRFKDRMGIVADISTILAKSGFNIISMEVDRSSYKIQNICEPLNNMRHINEALVYAEIENIEHKIHQHELFHIFDKIDSFIEIQQIDALPQEEKANRFKVVLDNMSDGVISIDKSGMITTINKVAAKTFMCNSEDVVGKSINNLNLPQYEILECLNGEKKESVKQNLMTPTGRFQYVSTCKPIRDSSGKIIGAVEIAKEMQEIKKLAKSISMENDAVTFSDIIGKNQMVKEAISIAQKIAPTDITVSLYGTSGTGKELFAKAIHSASNRKGLFIPVNCAALPEQLLESELFGYVGGAFTGGKKEGKQGLFEAAMDGTIFLDEIAEMPLGSQSKLLRLIQEKAVRRIGDSREIPVNTRIITATNQNLNFLVKEGKFREDLYYRINVIPIHIPPLKQRKDDIPVLLEHFLFQLLVRLGKKINSLTPAALEKLNRYDWPGNVRELKNVIERAAFLNSTNNEKDIEIDVEAIVFNHELIPYQKTNDSICTNESDGNIDKTVDGKIDEKGDEKVDEKGDEKVDKQVEKNWEQNRNSEQSNHNEFANVKPNSNGQYYGNEFYDESKNNSLIQNSLKETIGAFEKKIIIDVLNRKRTIRKAAKELQISHPALIKKMDKYNIKIDRTFSVSCSSSSNLS